MILPTKPHPTVDLVLESGLLELDVRGHTSHGHLLSVVVRSGSKDFVAGDAVSVHKDDLLFLAPICCKSDKASKSNHPYRSLYVK